MNKTTVDSLISLFELVVFSLTTIPDDKIKTIDCSSKWLQINNGLIIISRA